ARGRRLRGKSKRRPRWPPPTFSDRLEPVQKPSIHSHVVLVGEAVKAEHHPVQLDRAENQLTFSEVQAATEQHRHSAVANAGSRRMGAAKQSMSIGRETALRFRNHWPK